MALMRWLPLVTFARLLNEWQMDDEETVALIAGGTLWENLL
jgi:catalase (peroxidase I)